MTLPWLKLIWRIAVLAGLIALAISSTGLLQFAAVVGIFFVLAVGDPNSDSECANCSCQPNYEEDPTEHEDDYTDPVMENSKIVFDPVDHTTIRRALLFYMQNSQDPNTVARAAALHHRLLRLLDPQDFEHER